MARPKKTSGRVTTPPQTAAPTDTELPDLLVNDARLSIESDSHVNLEAYVSLVAALTGAPYAGEEIVPGGAILQACERANDVNGFFVASAIQRFGPPSLRGKAAAVVEQLTEAAGDEAERLLAVGTATPVRALALTEPHHNGHLILLESERPDASRVAVQVTIETSLRGAAVEFAHDVDADMVFAAIEEEPSLIADELTPADARAWVEHALVMRDEQFQINPEDDDDLASEEVLTIVRHVFAQCPDDGSLPDRAKLPTEDEIAQMIVDFRASPAVAELDAETQAGMEIHIDRIVDFGRGVSGRPMWWSTITAELFKQFADYAFPDEIDAIRPVVTAWAVWAGDTLGKDEMTITETMLAIERLLQPASAAETGGLTLPDPATFD